MDLQQAANYIRQNPNRYFDLGFIRDGRRMTVNRKVQPQDQAEKFLKFIRETNPETTIFIEMYAPNGSSYRFIERYLLDPNDRLSGTVPGGSSGPPNSDLKDFIIQTKDDKIRELSRELEIFREKARKRKKTNEKLEKELLEKKHEDEIKEVQSSGLNGVLQNEELLNKGMDLLGQILLNQNGGVAVPTQIAGADPESGDLSTMAIQRAQAFNDWFFKQPEDIQEMTYMILDRIAKEPDETRLILKHIINLLKNGTTARKTGTDD